MNHHVTQGRIVAEARYFLERYEKAEQADAILADVNGAVLTDEHLRVLLAEHDAYRNEARELSEHAHASVVDAATSFRTELEVARDAAHKVWQDARTAEQAAWELYRGEDFDHQAAWQAAREVKRGTETAFDQLDRACKTLGKAESDAKAVANVREQARKASAELAAQAAVKPTIGADR